MISEEAKEIIRRIARVQLESLNKLLKDPKSMDSDLRALYNIPLEEYEKDANEIIHQRLSTYLDVCHRPEQIKLLSLYQLTLCSYILSTLEESWLSEAHDDPDHTCYIATGIYDTWAIIRELDNKFKDQLNRIFNL